MWDVCSLIDGSWADCFLALPGFRNILSQSRPTLYTSGLCCKVPLPWALNFHQKQWFMTFRFWFLDSFGFLFQQKVSPRYMQNWRNRSCWQFQPAVFTFQSMAFSLVSQISVSHLSSSWHITFHAVKNTQKKSTALYMLFAKWFQR